MVLFTLISHHNFGPQNWENHEWKVNFEINVKCFFKNILKILNFSKWKKIMLPEALISVSFDRTHFVNWRIIPSTVYNY